MWNSEKVSKGHRATVCAALTSGHGGQNSVRLNEQLGNICSFQLVPAFHAASWERESRKSLEASLGCGVGLRVQSKCKSKELEMHKRQPWRVEILPQEC